MQDFIKLSASVHELSCSQCFDDAENDTAVAVIETNRFSNVSLNTWPPV